MTPMKDMPYHSGIKFRAYFSTEQQRIADANLGAARFIYNRLVSWNDELYLMRKTVAFVPAYNDRIAFLSEAVKSAFGMKAAVPFLNGKDIDSLMIDNVFANYRKAWERFMEVPGTGKPSAHKFSYDGSYQTNPHYRKDGTYLNDGNVKLLDKHHLQVPILGRVKISGSDARIQWLIDHMDSTRFGTITVSVDSVGRYFISVQLGSMVPFTDKLPSTGKAVGIDMNVENFCADSDGVIVDSPKYRRDIQRKLSKLQRGEARRCAKAKSDGRKLKSARNYQKARKRAALLQMKAAGRREQFQDEVSKRYIVENDIIVTEDLKVKNLLKNHCLAFSIADQAWGSFFEKLVRKAAMYGRIYIKVPPHYTTQTCNVCGYVMKEENSLDLSIREWTCPSCGTHHIRDINAAKTILRKGLAILHQQEAA